MSTSHPTTRLIGWALLTLATVGQADQVYKYVDAQGHVTYSDRPNTAGARKTEVTFQQADPHEAARLAKESQLLKAEEEQRRKQQSTDDRIKAKQDHDKAARCEAARANYNAIKADGRLFTLDPNGNKVYYTDAEADAKREAARQVMNTACGT